MSDLDRFRQEIDEFLGTASRGEDYYAVLFGSIVHRASRRSDIDLMVFVPSANDELLDAIRQFHTKLHVENDRDLDDEVPAENKLLISYADVRESVGLHAFERPDGTIEVPPIEKRSEVLGSYHMRLRLVLNALTVPHLAFGSDLATYQQHRRDAEGAVAKLALALSGGLTRDPATLLDCLKRGPRGHVGEFYLGYKDVAVVDEYVKRYLLRELGSL